jgi:hypothetical protein
MTGAIRIAAGVLLLAHGLVHLLYLSADTPEFSLERSWLVPEAARRPVALALMGATVAAFGLLAVAGWGMPGLSSVWPAVAVVASALSIGLLAAFWSWSLVFGVVIDAALIAAAVARPEWVERVVG